MQTTLQQIAQHNPQRNALVSLADEDVLLRQADERGRIFNDDHRW
jgi:hypothetical protein